MNTFFLTAYQGTEADGGRDGLGLLPLWSQVARRCIWNLTSISSDLAGWRSLLVCSWMADRVTADVPGLDQRDTMLAAERLVGLARCFAPDPSVRDTERLRGSTRLVEERGRVRVSGPDRITVLKGQGATGVVGQVGRPAIRSGLLTEELKLTGEARAHVEPLLEPLDDEVARLKAWLLDGAPIDLADPPGLLDVVAKNSSSTPTSEDEARWLLDHVARCVLGVDPDGGWTLEGQAALVDALLQLPTLEHAPHALPDLLRRHLGEGPVRRWLGDIQALEALLGRMDELFAWMRCETARPREWEVLKGRLQAQWEACGWTTGFSEHRDRALGLVDGLVPPDERPAFEWFAKGVGTANPSECLLALLERNQQVVARRGRRPWLLSDHPGETVGSVRAEITTQRSELRETPAWEHSYYLSELQRIVRACRGPSADGGGR